MNEYSHKNTRRSYMCVFNRSLEGTRSSWTYFHRIICILFIKTYLIQTNNLGLQWHLSVTGNVRPSRWLMHYTLVCLLFFCCIHLWPLCFPINHSHIVLISSDNGSGPLMSIRAYLGSREILTGLYWIRISSCLPYMFNLRKTSWKCCLHCSSSRMYKL